MLDKIYLKTDKKPKTIKDILVALFIKDENGNRKEYPLLGYSNPTYHDEKYTQLQSGNRKLRSIDDLIIIVRTYLNIKRSDLFIIKKILTSPIRINDKKYFPYIYNCTEISKPTLMFYEKIIGNNLYNHHCTNSKYKNWQEIISMMGFKSHTEYKNHVLNLTVKK